MLIICRPTVIYSLLPKHINMDMLELSDHGFIAYCLPLPRPASSVKQSKMIQRLHNSDHDPLSNTATVVRWVLHRKSNQLFY